MIISCESQCTVLFAAAEISRYWSKMTGEVLLINEDNPPTDEDRILYLGTVEWMSDKFPKNHRAGELKDDGFYIDSDGRCIYITSDLPRGVLFGVYHLLEALGCKWIFPSEDGEYIPKVDPDAQIEAPAGVYNPDYTVRSFVEGGFNTPIESFAWETINSVDWMAKNKINTYFLHAHPSGEFEISAILLGELSKRGMRFEYGGHGTQMFVDRALFSENPSMFRMADGERKTNGNFCASSPEAIEMVVNGAMHAAEKLPELDVLHLFFDDSYGESWCDCEKCHEMTPTQQMINVIEKVSEQVKQQYPHLKIVMLLYHDSLDMSSIDSDAPVDLVGLYAPRERCYAHSIADPGCKRNADYYRLLKESRPKFKYYNSFEYYSDMILFDIVSTDLTGTIQGDLHEYKAAGVDEVSCLMFNATSWWLYKWNMLLFAKCSFNNKTDVKALKSEFCEALYGPAAETMLEFCRSKEEMTCALFQFCEYITELVGDIRNITPQAKEFNLQHIESIKSYAGIMEEWRLRIIGLANDINDPNIKKALNDELISLQITIWELHFTYFKMMARFRKAYEPGFSSEDFSSMMEKSISYKTMIRNLLSVLPEKTCGINGSNIGIPHLCDDQVNWMKTLS